MSREKFKIESLCKYVYDVEIHGKDQILDMGSCNYCLRDRNRTCPTGIYDNTIISFKNRHNDE